MEVTLVISNTFPGARRIPDILQHLTPIQFLGCMSPGCPRSKRSWFLQMDTVKEEANTIIPGVWRVTLSNGVTGVDQPRLGEVVQGKCDVDDRFLPARPSSWIEIVDGHRHFPRPSSRLPLQQLWLLLLLLSIPFTLKLSWS